MMSLIIFIINRHLEERNILVKMLYLVYCMQKIDRQKEKNNNANTLFVKNKKRKA